MPRILRRLACLAGTLFLAGCARSEPAGIALIAAFSDETQLGTIHASWQAAESDKEGRRALRYRVDADNLLSEGVFLRLSHFRLTGVGELAPDGNAVACVLAPGHTSDVLSGTLWVDPARVDDIGGFEIDRFALPLSQRGRAFYREFKLRQLPGQDVAIDAEIAAAAAAPACGGG